MNLFRFVSAPPASIEKKNWHSRSLIVFGLFVVASSIAPLMSPDYIWDDLVWYWTYRIDGTQALFHYLNQVGHAAFWPFLDLPYRVFGAHATLPITVISLAFHFANAYLISRLIFIIGAQRNTAFLSFVVYLLTPFYFNRGTVSHYFYDVFLFLWLYSVYTGVPEKSNYIKRYVIAPVSQIMAFGLPTLIMLEPFRLMVHWSVFRGDIKKISNSVAPYWAIALCCMVITFLIFKPSGYYEGYNRLDFNFERIFYGLSEYFLYVPKALLFHFDNTISVLRQPLDWPFAILFGLLSVYFVRLMPKSEKRTKDRHTKHLLLISLLLFLAGAAPYILASRYPAPGEFNSRLFYVSGIGCVIAASILFSKISPVRARILIVSSFVVFFLVSGLQQAKAYMYDYLVRQTVLTQLQEHMVRLEEKKTDRQDMYIGLTAEPPFWELTVQNRLFDPMEFSVPLNVDKNPKRGRWFVQYLDFRSFHPPDYMLPPHECTIAAHDRHPCPDSYILAKYQVEVKELGITKFSFLRLYYESFMADTPMQIGQVVLLTNPKPMNINAMAFRWFNRLAEKGDAEAQNKLGLMYLNGFADVPQNDAQAFKWFQKSNVQGDLDARLNLGLMYLEGRAVGKNHELAARLIHTAANEGNALAQYNYGVLLERGFGVAKDAHGAFTWYLKAADQGHRPAQARTGWMYAYGVGTSQNLTVALRWLRKAASTHDRQAQFTLAMLYLEGHGVSKNSQTAHEYLRRAADQGFGPAQFLLGSLYQHGVGVSIDSGEAYFWYKLAGQNSEGMEERTNAAQAGKAVSHLLSEKEKRALNQRLKNWRPVHHKSSPAWNN